jgi:DNA-binding transcriptional ArsR family regulator
LTNAEGLDIVKEMLNHSPDLDRVFHALSDASRRCMVERLSKGPTTVSELAQPLSISLAAVVQHVQVLEACGLVRTHKVGRSRTCSLNREKLSEAERWMAQRRASVTRQLDRLDQAVQRT